ncbi:hypothetical protein ABW19_dt0200952 [Dactylella cylindrospora]|nr:hypothetical protein ABW19_dt0200952 [Dactylella cylindrospora]
MAHHTEPSSSIALTQYARSPAPGSPELTAEYLEEALVTQTGPTAPTPATPLDEENLTEGFESVKAPSAPASAQPGASRPIEGSHRERWEFIQDLKSKISPMNPGTLITKSFHKRQDESFDIVMISIKNGGEYEGCLAGVERDHWRRELEALAWFRVFNERPANNETTLLLVQDLSLAMIDFLCGKLELPTSFVYSHLVGMSGRCEDGRDEYPLDYYNSYLADRKGVGFEYRQSVKRGHEQEYEWKTFKRRPFNSGDANFQFNWSRVCLIDVDIQEQERKSLEKEGPEPKPKPKVKKHAIRLPEKRTNAPKEPPGWNGIYYRIHRPYLAITPQINEEWLVAADERFSRVAHNFKGRRLVVCLFDPPRKITQSGEPVLLFRGVSERAGPALDTYIQREIEEENRAKKFKTTRDIFLEFLGTWEEAGGGPLHSLNLEMCELHFIQGRLREYFDTLTTIDHIIDDIDRLMQDSTQLQSNATNWGKLLSSYRLVLSQMAHSINMAYEYIRVMNIPNNKTLDVSIKQFKHTVDQLSGFREHVYERTNSTFQAVISSMSIIESQQAIYEASSVGKLTELAFIFIPMSFAAAFYSMQIDDLNATTNKFFTLAAILLLCSYTVRLFVRSRVRIALQHVVQAPIYNAAVVTRGQPIPTMTYASFYSSPITKSLFRGWPVGLFCTSAIVLPLILGFGEHTAFKVIGCILTIALGLSIDYDIHRARASGGLEPYQIVLKCLAIASAFGVIIVGIELDLENAVKVSGSLGCGAIFFMAAGATIVSTFEAGHILAVPTITVALSALIWLPWLHQPNMEPWKKALVTICFLLSASAISSGVAFLNKVFLGLRHHELKFGLTFRIVHMNIPIMGLVFGVPLVFIWMFPTVDPPGIPRWAQLLLTLVDFTVPTMVLFCSVATLSSSTIFILFILMLACWFLLLPLIIWRGGIKEMDAIPAGAKASITGAWVSTLGTLLGYYFSQYS